jgi:hypothetical protein
VGGRRANDQSGQAKYNLARLSNTESGNLNDLLGDNIDVSGAPRAGNADYLRYAASNVRPQSDYDSAGGPQRTFDPSLPLQQYYAASSGPMMGYDNYGNQKTVFDYAGPIQSSYVGSGSPLTGYTSAGSQQMTFGDAGPIRSGYGDGKDALTSRSNVENSLFSRMQPQNDRDLEKLRSQLADQGIRYGSQAYTAAMDNYNRGINDQRLAITAQGGQEQKLQEDIAAQRAGFANAAEQQAYVQAQGRGTFANTAQAVQEQQNQQHAAFYNAAQKQLEDMVAQRAGFANAAQQQAYAQAQGRGTFANAAQAAGYQQNQQRASFFNTAQQQLEDMAAARAGFANAAEKQAFDQAQARAQFGNTAQSAQYQQNALRGVVRQLGGGAAAIASRRPPSTPRTPRDRNICPSNTRCAISRSTRSPRCCRARKSPIRISSTPSRARSRPPTSPD